MPQFEVTLHGTRGSVPAPGKDFILYGGHTSCVSVKVGDRLIVLDAGTGIIPLGQKLIKENTRTVDIFLTHAHYDHIQGLPFFAPLLNSGKTITLWYAGCGALQDGAGLMDHVFSAPFLPFNVSDIPSRLEYQNLFRQGGAISLSEDITLRTIPVNHPDGCLAMRVEAFGKSFVYAPDFEHDDGPWDADLLAFIDQASFAVLDATYTSHEYEDRKGFGHTFWEKSIVLGEDANLQKWALFHHLFTRSDDQLQQIDAQVSQINSNVRLARDGMTYDLMVSKYGDMSGQLLKGVS